MLANKKQDTPPEYMNRYTPVRLKPLQIQGNVRVIRASSHGKLCLSSTKLIREAIIGNEYMQPLQANRTHNNSKLLRATYQAKKLLTSEGAFTVLPVAENSGGLIMEYILGVVK